MDLKDRINVILTENNINGAKLASILGLGKSGIYKILRGDTNKLQVETIDLINNKFPQYSKEWLRGEESVLKKPLNEDTNKMIEDLVLNNEEALMNNEVFKAWFNLKLKKHELKLLKELEQKGALKKAD